MLRLQSIFGRKNAALPKLLKDVVGKTNKPDLYLEAVTHISSNKKDKKINYERLEFLGDSVLGSIVSEYLFLERPESDEGYLSKTRSKIVSRKHLNSIGKELKLSDCIKKDPNTQLPKDIDGDLLESIIGAMFLDKGYENTKKFVLNTILNSEINLSDFDNETHSFKSNLHEWSQKVKSKVVFHTYKEEDGNLFCSLLSIDEELEFTAKGFTKKKAEENASELAWKRILEIKQ